MRSLWALVVVASLVACAFGQRCSQDFECGNFPYVLCMGGINDCSGTGHGLGVDEVTNQVYFSQICRTDTPDEKNITIKRVNASCSAPITVQSRASQNGTNNLTFFDVVNDELYYSLGESSKGYPLAALNLTSLTESLVDTGGSFQNAIEFDLKGSKTYTCNLVTSGKSSNYTIDRFNGILGQTIDGSGRQQLYNLRDAACTAIRQAKDNILYFSTYEPIEGTKRYVTKLARGSSSCTNCRRPAIVFSLNDEKIQDFDVTDDAIYYATTSGVFKCDLDGENVNRIAHSCAYAVRVLGNRVFWNTGTSIMSSDFDGDNVKQVNKVQGSCECRTGFGGVGCEYCDGQVQHVNNLPVCVPIDENGNPVSCHYDYDCTYNPFNICKSNKCECRPGLAGVECNQCANATQTLSWRGGLPRCS